MDVCIKNINKEDWRQFKEETNKHGVRAGDFFNRLVNEHKDNCNGSNWEKVLNGSKVAKDILTREEVAKIHECSKKTFKMRI